VDESLSAVAEIQCAACGEPTPAGGRFCIHCGTPAQQACPSCGEPLVPGARFCMQCGTRLDGIAGSVASSDAPAASVSERRLVSVLFADLVGFTTLSEHRDPEEVRELLSEYFERCRTLIERYGGTVEKFIGDAVMAVWGTPVAREDDAERAVRAGLSLTEAVSALGEAVGMPELRVRAGVLTGNAAVEVGSEGEGMVLGDTVNTASRLQSTAAPGTVLVDDVTRRASEAAIAYEDAGLHELKGREQPVQAWTALRVVAGAGGARRSVGVEAPFVGRGRDLQRVIEAGEESATGGRARLVSVVGDAGAGKSRLLWEYFKYLDGIQDLRWWHQGRCLSYGEGVAYWALAEMVRARAGILEEEPPGAAREKLHEAVYEQVSDERERRLVEPRLAHLLRLEERPDADRADLFSGWRLFFERMAGTNPVILAFEDLQWADSGLLEFIDYLLEWSADFPIFVLALGRPELREKRPGWELMSLSPLAPDAIVEIVDGLAPGLPPDLLGQIGRRAEGIPLYAVETVRMLQDRGLLVQEGARYVLTADVSDLDVPETLHALVASRLDGLSPGERTLLQDASVLGQAFSAAGVAALSGRPESELTGVLDALVVKQVLAHDADPRSPERGQYVFLQALLRTVAYGTLARRTRKARHLAAAAYLRGSWPGELADIAEVLASHYLAAIEADPEAGDAAQLRASARETLTAAGRAAASLALGPEAERYFEHAAELADGDRERAELFELAGRALQQSGNVDGAERRLREAVELYRRSGDELGGSATVALAAVRRHVGALDEARRLLVPFRDSQGAGVDRIVRASALAELGAACVFAGDLDEAGPLLDEALTVLEQDQAWAALAEALISHAIYLITKHRRHEAGGIMRVAIALAEQHDLPAVGLRARFNYAALSLEADRFTECVTQVDETLSLARERGDRFWEDRLLMQSVAPLVALGRWDQAVERAAMISQSGIDAAGAAAFIGQVAAARGDDEALERCRALAEIEVDSSYVDQSATAAISLARAALERSAPGEALAQMRPVISAHSTASEVIEEGYALAIEAAFALGDEAAMVELAAVVAALPPARATTMLRAGRARLDAELAHRRGDAHGAERAEAEAIALLRSVGARPLLGRALEERAGRREDPEALDEARAIYAELGATRWLARLRDSSGVPA
jgi:class 3 adenylate cyclase/tetratricopeptide (TPR) repeat protein